MSSLLAAALWFASLTAAAQAVHVDVQGSTRLGDMPEPDVVVWLESPSLPRSLDSRRTVLDQRNLRFSPRVLAVQVGTTVDFPNNDRVFHNVFSFRDGKKFDLGLYPIGSVKRVTFDKPGVSRIFCNIHPHMAAYVVAVDSPVFAVSDETGTFTLRDVPEGTYTYHAWRAGAQPVSGVVTLRPGEPLDIRWP
jgi:plastocyanin